MTIPDVLVSRKTGVISDSIQNLKMVNTDSIADVPPNVLEMLRMFLTASSRGDHVSLVLESRMNSLSTKYWSVQQPAGVPAQLKNKTTQKKKMNPSRLRRSRLRQEEFFQMKKNKATSGTQKAAELDQDASETRQLVVQIEDQHLDTDCNEELDDGIPQLDGIDSSTNENISSEEESMFTFVSNYAEEDIIDALKELKDDDLLPNLPTLISRVRVEPRSADHLCTVLLDIPASVVNFNWPELRGCPDFFKNVKRL